MQRKSGYCWEAVFDEKKNIYTAGFFSAVDGSCTLYEINKEMYDRLIDGMDNTASSIFGKGRKLYMHVNDRCGPPYTIVFDEDYKDICPWAKVPELDPQETWPKEMTDSVIDVMESEKDNREQRRKKREKRAS